MCGTPSVPENVLSENLDAVATVGPAAFLFSAPPGACARTRKHASMNSEARLSLRCSPGNADHHLWNNNGTFWCHFTVHLPDFTKERLRLSLGTAEVHHARKLRDSLLTLFGGAGHA
jgi:hypothetical protein